MGSGNISGTFYPKLPMGRKYTTFGQKLTHLSIKKTQNPIDRDLIGVTGLLKVQCDIYCHHCSFLFH